MQPIVHLLSVAGSSSQCARCTAMSKRTKEQCGRPVVDTSGSQKCELYGPGGIVTSVYLQHATSPWQSVRLSGRFLGHHHLPQ
jgi:hypothetical protein